MLSERPGFSPQLKGKRLARASGSIVELLQMKFSAGELTVADRAPAIEANGMSALEIIEEFKTLSDDERARVAKFVVENDDSWIPESFKQGMADAEAGRLVDMESVLSGAPPPRREGQ